jgi:flagellar biosynthesis/type III secretory pathway chaperone
MECLKKQKDCYTQLLEIARRQQKAINEKSDPGLLQALKDKNPILQTLQTLDEEVRPTLNSISDTDRQLMIQEGQGLKDEIAQTLEQLIEIEDACSKFLKDKKQDIFEQIKELQEYKKGLKGYGQSGGKSSHFSQEG